VRADGAAGDAGEATEQTPRILVGGDDPRAGRAVRRALAAEARLVWAAGGEQLLLLARSEPRPDLILLEATLNDADGYELCRRLSAAQETRAIPVLLVRTTRDRTGGDARAFEVGAADWVSRPLDEATLRARVRTHLELARLRAQAASAAGGEAPAGAADQRGVEEHLVMEWRRAAREATPVSIVALRLDHFRACVDALGREAGEEVLRRVAAELARSIRRPMDFLGRYGDDGFVAVLPSTEEHGAAYLAERMLELVEFLDIPRPGSPVAPVVTASAGVATTIPYPETEPWPLLEVALEALRRAEEGGGNRVGRIEPAPA
jgi:diguanylate cyclase (GGDEF)-like protein